MKTWHYFYFWVCVCICVSESECVYSFLELDFRRGSPLSRGFGVSWVCLPSCRLRAEVSLLAGGAQRAALRYRGLAEAQRLRPRDPRRAWGTDLGDPVLAPAAESVQWPRPHTGTRHR